MGSPNSLAAASLEACRRLVHGALGCGLALLDEDGRVELWSAGAVALLGVTAEQAAGRSLAEALDVRDAEPAWPAASLAATLAQGCVDEERWVRTADGRTLRAELTWSRIEAGEGSAPAIALVLRDGTSRWKSRRQLEECLSILSHELRTPMTAIVGWAHLLRRGKLDEASREHAVEVIDRNARLQAQLIGDVGEVARIVTGRLRLVRRKVDPRSVLRGAVEAVRADAEAKGVRIALDDEKAGATADLDPNRIQQVVANLVANAVKFTPRSGQVSVSARRSGSDLEIYVQDTGAGIAPEDIPHLFERFWQGGPRPPAGGLGLTLAITHHVVGLHGGTIAAASDGPGKGATLTVRLPVEG